MSTYLDFYVIKDKKKPNSIYKEDGSANYDAMTHLFGLQTCNDIIGRIYENLGYWGDSRKPIKLDRYMLEQVGDDIAETIKSTEKRIKVLKMLIENYVPDKERSSQWDYAYELVEMEESLKESYELQGQLRIFYWMLDEDVVYITVS